MKFVIWINITKVQYNYVQNDSFAFSTSRKKHKTLRKIMANHATKTTLLYRQKKNLAKSFSWGGGRRPTFYSTVHKLLLPLISVDFWNQIFENSREYGNFENYVPPPPTWHQILKPIRMLVTIFISYTSIYMQVLNTHKVGRNLKDTFDYRPTRPIKTRFALARPSAFS